MEETLGKRIVSHRKRLGMTQDRLAELLGVTAQAVSKWENDQSCPDITTLPKLAEIFDSSTDELLGLEKKEVHPAETVTEKAHPAEIVSAEEDAPESNGLRYQNGKWEFQWDGGRKSSLGFALWVLISGVLLLISYLFHPHANLWGILWRSGLLTFGLFGLYPKFSFFRLGCGLFGAFTLLNYFHIDPFVRDMGWLLPIFLLLFGLSLLVDALRKPKKGAFHVMHNGHSLEKSEKNYCKCEAEIFECSTAFGENYYLIQLPRMSGGTAEVSFGELTADLSGCQEIADQSHIGLGCSFGTLNLLIPKSCCAKPETSTAFAEVQIKGAPDPNAETTVYLECNASFGEIVIQYI